MSAGIAYVMSIIVYGYGVRLKRAREIGSYELVRQLGSGGMGDVWVAQHRMLARPAAMKLIRPELLGTDAHGRSLAVARFEREAQATAALGSKHTVGVYDFGVTEDGSFFYVMELLNGLSLETLVRSTGRCRPRARCICSGRCAIRLERHTRPASSIATSSRRTSSPAASDLTWIS